MEFVCVVQVGWVVCVVRVDGVDGALVLMGFGMVGGVDRVRLCCSSRRGRLCCCSRLKFGASS